MRFLLQEVRDCGCKWSVEEGLERKTEGGVVNMRIFASVLWPSKELKSLFTELAFLSMMRI